MAKAQGNCGSYTTRWWFNAGTGNCEEYLYSGCQGNDNNFGTYTDCQDFCRDTKGNINQLNVNSHLENSMNVKIFLEFA